MVQKKKILITGATGFLGSHLLKSLLKNTNYQIVVLKRSFSNIFRINAELKNSNVTFYDLDKTELKKIFDENQFETIIHCATNYGRNDKDIVNIVQSNLILPLTLLQLGIEHGVKNFINTDTVIDKKVNHYSLSKNQFLDWLEECSSKIKCVNISLEHFYGAFDNESKFTTSVIHKLMKKIEHIDLTKGEQKRYFIHIDDVTTAFLTILKNIDTFENQLNSFEVSTEQNISIKDFILTVKKLTNNNKTKLNFGAIEYRKNELMECKTDISALKKLGWTPKVSLEEGIKQTIREELSE